VSATTLSFFFPPVILVVGFRLSKHWEREYQPEKNKTLRCVKRSKSLPRLFSSDSESGPSPEYGGTFLPPSQAMFLLHFGRNTLVMCHTGFLWDFHPCQVSSLLPGFPEPLLFFQRTLLLPRQREGLPRAFVATQTFRFLTGIVMVFALSTLWTFPLLYFFFPGPPSFFPALGSLHVASFNATWL